MMVDSDSFNKIFALAALATMMVLAGAMIVSLDDSDAKNVDNGLTITAGQTKTFTWSQVTDNLAWSDYQIAPDFNTLALTTSTSFGNWADSSLYSLSAESSGITLTTSSSLPAGTYYIYILVHDEMEQEIDEDYSKITVSSSSGGSTDTLHYLDDGGTLPNMGTSSSPLSSFSITMDHKGFWKDATMYIYKGSCISIIYPFDDEVYDSGPSQTSKPAEFGLNGNRLEYGKWELKGTLTKSGTLYLESFYTDDYDSDNVNITWTINVVESPTEYTCHLNFDMAGGTGGPDNLDYSSIQTTAHEFTVPSTAPSKEGYQFMGWAVSDAPTAVRYHGGDTVPVAYNATVTLVAVWQAIAPQQVSITFGSNNTDYGKVSEGAIIVQKGSSYRIDGNCLYFGDITVRAEPEVAPSGYVNSFKSWSVTEEGIINEGMYIIATFEQVQIPVDQTAYYAKLVFDANGGSDAPNSIIMQALSASRPGNVEITVPDTAPVRAGHTFVGWADTSDAKAASYRAGDKVSVAYDTDISKVTTIYAVWSANCEITFNSNGGSDVQSITVKSGDKAREPSAPVRAGYTFAGWYTADDRAYDWNSPVTSSFVLKAKWNDDRVTFTVSFDTMGAKAIPSIAVTKGHAIDKKQMPEDPVKEGYEFGGWYLDEDCKKSFDVSSEINESFTLYAKWVAEENNFVVDHAVALIGIALFILGAFLYVRDYENKFIPVALLGLAIVVCHLVGWTGAVDDFIKGFF